MTINARQLIINADDFGLSDGANRAIIACHKAGSLRSTTMMVNMPATEEAFAIAKENPGLGVGLHFNLTLGEPLSDNSRINSLIGNDNRFLTRAIAEKKAISGKYNSAQIECELGQQWDRFLSFGLTPTHLDSHQHIHAFPQVFNVVAQFCVDHCLPLRIPWPWNPPLKRSLRRKMRAWMLKWMINRNMKQWGGRLHTNGSFASIFDLHLEAEKISLTDYLNILQSQHQSPLELMVHPANVDLEHTKMTEISEVSRRDFEIFSSENFGAIARDLGYDLINYSNLTR